nr:hypothetical protein [uncultured Cohaesibacter sp.]
MMTLTEQLLTVATTYGEAHKKPLSAVSRQFFNSGTRLGAIEDGGTLTVRSFEKAMQEFSEHWPSNVEWPSDIPRPSVAEGDKAPAA